MERQFNKSHYKNETNKTGINTLDKKFTFFLKKKFVC